MDLLAGVSISTNRLIALFAGGATTTYGYDAFGARVFQIVATTSTSTYPFKFFSIASTTKGSNNYASSTEYIFNGDTLLSTVDQGFKNGAATGSVSVRYVHPDHVGSTNVVTNENGALVQTLDYYPYGGTRVSVSTSTNEKRKFIGQFLDESNLEYLNARYYSPTQGQFISQDPSFLSVGDPGLVKQVTGRDQQMFLADPQLANSYSYGRDNPITQKDPDGKIVPLILGIVAVYSWAQVGVDAYDAYNTNVKYGAIFGVEEKNRTNGKLLYDAGTSVVGGVASIPKIGLKLLGDSLSLLTASMDILDQYGSQQIYGPYNEDRAKQNERAAKKESAVSTPKSGLNWSALNVRNTAQSVATRGSSGTQSWWTVTGLPSTVTQNGVTYVRNSSGLLNSTNSK